MKNASNTGHITSLARPTLKTIAKETGLATTTVSRALLDGPDISEETKKLVRDTAQRLGYRPNRAGVRLRTGKTNVISLVLRTDEQAMQHVAQLVSSVAAALRSTPYHLIITPSHPDEDVLAPIRYIVETGSADGVIVSQIQPRDERVAYLSEMGLPFVTHGRTRMEISHPYADYDSADFAVEAVRRLVARGRRRLGLIAPPARYTYAGYMAEGFLEAAGQAGVEAAVVEDIDSFMPSEVIEDELRNRFARPDHYDGLVISTNMATMAAVSAIESLELKLARDMDIVAREPVRVLPFFRKELIVAQDDLVKMGQQLAEAMIARIRDPEAPPIQRLVRAQFN
jgi:LacI family transcriptional regulator